MELKVGMYVITNDRMKIGLIKDFCTCEKCRTRNFYEPIIDNEIYLTDYDSKNNFHGYKFYNNLFDLVRVGDYVNGYKVNRIEKDYIVINEIWTGREFLKCEDIRSIVTKEQFESLSYKVGGIV